ncbi:MAG: glycosyltransferase family 9 protein [Flavobacteriales bacterium]|nr:glycosyltransferase family 9 protein [Flavobacteriales bacterium]
MPKQFLVIQTAFLGDAVLVTALLEKLHARYPDAMIDLVVRKGNEGLFGARGAKEDQSGTEARRAHGPANAVAHTHPFLRHLFVWDKRQGKTRALFRLIGELRKTEYDHIINAQRFLSTGLMTMLARGKEKVGYDKNPLSFLFTRKVPHVIGDPSAALGVAPHEVDRLNALIEHLTDASRPLPRLYPGEQARTEFQAHMGTWAHGHMALGHVCIAPASVWYTKQWPEHKWVELIKALPADQQVVLIGAPGDVPLCERIAIAAGRGQTLAGKLSLLATAALMERATMNYVNDSAPLHIASAMDAPVTAVFCSTVPAFGFGPLRENGRVVETAEKLDCRPCGLHGYKACPKGHFKCAEEILVATVAS